MARLGTLAILVTVLCTSGAGFAAPEAGAKNQTPQVVSTGKEVELKKVLQPESTTILLFIQDTSMMEQQFLKDLGKAYPETNKLALRVVRLQNLEAPAARQYKVTATPTAIVYDRFSRVLATTSQPEEIRSAVRKGFLMGRIIWVDEDNPKAPEVYGRPPEQLKRGIPGIVKAMSLRPDVFKIFNEMSQVHFSDGHLKRREHEMVAAYVSALNKCKF